MKFYYKELPEQVYAPNGRPIACDFVDPEGYGWIATDNGYVVHQIERAIQQSMGGFVPSNQQAYDVALKKKETAPPPKPSSNHSFPPYRLNQLGGAGFAAVANQQPVQPKPDPIAVPAPAQMAPRTGRMAPAKVVPPKKV